METVYDSYIVEMSPAEQVISLLTTILPVILWVIIVPIVLCVIIACLQNRKEGINKYEINIALHIVLYLLFGGYWRLVWIYRQTNGINLMSTEKERSPIGEILLCMFIPFYSVYWTYKSALSVNKALCRSSSDRALLCLIFEIFIPLVPYILMQLDVNALVALRNEQQKASIEV